MKKTSSLFIAVAAWGTLLPGANADQVPFPGLAAVLPTTNAPGPKIQFESPVYDFGRRPGGEIIKHTFFFTNTGLDTLVLTNVQPSCHCTVAGEWSRQVEPGKTGSIPIQLDTGGMPAGPIARALTVICNDKAQPAVYLQVKGTLWKPIEVSPMYAVLNVPPDSGGASATVRIVNNTEQPLVLSPPECSNRAFASVIKTNQPGKEYQLVISAVPPLAPGNAQGVVTVKSSSTNLPVISVTTWMNVQPPITIVPAQINLPQAPLANRVTPIVTIINNTTNPIALSEPALTAEGTEVQIREMQPGKYFSATLAFPPGYEVERGHPVEFTVKTTHPKYPVLKVPVFQLPRAQTVLNTPAPALAAPASPSVPRVVPRPAKTPTTLPPLPAPGATGSQASRPSAQ